jgi:hypothetical protein
MYKGWDVHAYTQTIIEMLPNLLEKIDNYCQFMGYIDRKIPDKSFKDIIDQLSGLFPNNPAITNMVSSYKDGCIVDPFLPNLNSAIVLEIVWKLLLFMNDSNMYEMMNMVLDDIGGTCVQGISHRLIFEFIYLHDICYDDYINSNQHFV